MRRIGMNFMGVVGLVEWFFELMNFSGFGRRDSCCARLWTAPKLEAFLIEAVSQGDAIDAPLARAGEGEAECSRLIEPHLRDGWTCVDRTAIFGLHGHEVASCAAGIAHRDLDGFFECDGHAGKKAQGIGRSVDNTRACLNSCRYTLPARLRGERGGRRSAGEFLRERTHPGRERGSLFGRRASRQYRIRLQ